MVFMKRLEKDSSSWNEVIFMINRYTAWPRSIVKFSQFAYDINIGQDFSDMKFMEMDKTSWTYNI